jgi:hypothetical protein
MIPSCGKDEVWLIRSKNFLAKAKRCGFKDLLLGKLSIPNVDKKIDAASDIGKKKSIIIKLNEIAFTEIILSIDVKASRGKVAFNIIRGCKTKDYPVVNGSIA